MLDTPEIVKTNAQKTAVIHIVVPRNEIQTVMGPGIREIFAALAQQRIAPSGPWFAHHLRLDPKIFDLEISVPVATAIEPMGRVKPGELAAATVARAIYRGPYEGLGQAWGEFKQWVDNSGHQAAPNIWEVYTVGPESSSNPQDWRTEFNQPLVL